MMKRVLFVLAAFAIASVPAWLLWRVTNWRMAPYFGVFGALALVTLAEKLGYIKRPSELNRPTTLFAPEDRKAQ